MDPRPITRRPELTRRGGTVATPYGTRSAAQGYNPSTGTAARGVSGTGAERLGRSGPGIQRKNRNLCCHGAGRERVRELPEARWSRRTATPRTASIRRPRREQRGRCRPPMEVRGAAAVGANGNTAAAGQTANGNKYAASNGNVYKNTGSGWQQTQGTPHQGSASGASGANSAAARGYGGQEHSSGSAFGGGESGWQSRAESSRGAQSRGGGGGGGGRRR